ncbi:MAG TPA: Uma2 family endonuclease [Polyangiaceae bacterium]|nr:Uma2 family endonuclease [Polyangiaceae bacterium]
METSVSENVRLLRRVEYDKLVDLGVFEDERIELLEGELVYMSPIGARHCSAVQKLTELLVLALHGRAVIRPQLPLAASDFSEPEPDLLVAPLDEYDTAHPCGAHLVIEVAESSLAKDRGIKRRIYAENGVPEYWIVNVVARTIEVYSQPSNGAYAHMVEYTRGDSITLAEFPDVRVRVLDIMR